MKSQPLTLLLPLLLLCGAALADTAAPVGQLPRLGKPLTLDGKLIEWTDTACIPVRDYTDIAFCSGGHAWQGPKDAGMEVSAAWNADGLCLAVKVADDNVINNMPDKELFNQDAVEIYIDGRIKEFGQPHYGPGVYRMLVRPPQVNSEAALISLNAPVPGTHIAGERTTWGYVVEMLIPWSAFPELTPRAGATIGLQFALDDYDKRDGATEQPLMMTYHAATGLAMNPQKFMRFALVNELDIAAPQLGQQSSLQVPAIVASTKFDVKVQFLPPFAERVRRVQFYIEDANGVIQSTATQTAWPHPEPWQDSKEADFPLDLRKLPAGKYHVQAVYQTNKGETLGKADGDLLNLGDPVGDAYAHLSKANLPQLVMREPFRAAAYLGVAATVEKLKRAIEWNSGDEIIWYTKETAARIEALEKSTVSNEDPLLKLLALTTNPEAQVVVEYPQPNSASVEFYYGAYPLCQATVTQYPDAEKAQAAIGGKSGDVIDSYEQIAINGQPALVRTDTFKSEKGQWSAFDPAKQVLITRDWKYASLLNAADLGNVQVEAVAILENCVPSVREQVTNWAKQQKLEILPLKEALAKGRVLIAGDARLVALGNDFPINTVVKTPYGRELKLVLGTRVVDVLGASRAQVEHAAALIAAGKAVTPGDVDVLRTDLLAAVTPTTNVNTAPALPEGTHLYLGDVHMHTFYSDGSPSPVGLMMEAIYSNLDYAVITDHNTLKGAQLAAQLLQRFNVAFPVGIGEEITASWAHVNAFPVKELISWKLTPYETVKAAHAEGAVIQWNHPGVPGGPWDTAHQADGLADTGMDAWEHFPPYYDQWKGAKSVPTLTGASDTYTGTFDTLERTIVAAPSPAAADVAEAIRWKRELAILPGPDWFYGHPSLIARLCADLAQGTALKTAKADALRAMLKDADVVGLLKASRARVE